MLADQIHVAVRPRSVMECLDLAVLFCGRRPLAVAVATAVGATPMIACNRLLATAGITGLLPAFWVLAMQTAWASIPLTLYLGQAVFSRRFSRRQAVRAAVTGLPALILFQGLLRGLCLLLLILAPLVFVSMYYLGPIILLERPPLGRVWGRRGMMNRGQSGRVLGLAMLDGGILALGTWLGTAFLGAVTAAWDGRAVRWLPDAGGAGLVAALFSWHGQIAFWATSGFLTVFRFFTYLDARIRREGWDVELKLRAAETYAGLDKSTGRRPAGVALVLVAVIAGAVAPVAAAEDDAGRARRALASQSFPWYDADRDAYRSLIRSDAPAGDATDDSEDGAATDGRSGRAAGSGRGSGSGSGSGGGGAGLRRPPSLPAPPPLTIPGLQILGQVLLIVLLVVAGLGLVYLVVRFGGRRRRPPVARPGDDPGTDDDPLAALPEAARLAAGDLLERASTHAARGEFGQAMLFFYAWQLTELDTRGALELARGKTNGQYAREVARAAPAAAGLFRRSSRLFEDAFFGSLPVGRDDFLAVWRERDLVARSLAREPAR